LLHGEVGTADDARAEKESLDIISFVEIEREGDDFFGSETRAPNIAGAAIDTVVAIVKADVGEEDF